LKQGKILGMFPEGKRSAGQMIEAHPGSAMIAAHNHATILPVAISGSEKIHGWHWIPGRPRVTLNIGQPFKLPGESTLNKEELAKYTALIMKKIAELLPKKYHGKYAVSERK
jgi:1-acyl-sn-glycerol-3-phosphate acyltransferase